MIHSLPTDRRCALLALATGPAWFAGARAQPVALQAAAAYLDALNRHDAQAVAAQFCEDGALQLPSNPVGFVGVAAILEAMRATFTVYPDLHIEPRQMAEIDDRNIVKQFRMTGTWSGRFLRGPLAGRAPTDRAFAVDAVELLEARDGRIVVSKVYFDQLAVMLQIGAVSL